MKEGGLAAQRAIGGGEPAFEIGKGRAGQHIDIRHIARMHMGVGGDDAGFKGVAGGAARALPVERMTGVVNKLPRQFFLRRPVATHNLVANAQTVGATGGAKHTA